MNTPLRSRTMQWTCGLLMALPLTVLAADDIDSMHDMPGDGLVEVENVAGLIDISVWERNEVHVRGRIGDDVEEVEIESTAIGLRIEVRNKRNQRQIDSTYL